MVESEGLEDDRDGSGPFGLSCVKGSAGRVAVGRRMQAVFNLSKGLLPPEVKPFLKSLEERKIFVRKV